MTGSYEENDDVISRSNDNKSLKTSPDEVKEKSIRKIWCVISDNSLLLGVIISLVSVVVSVVLHIYDRADFKEQLRLQRMQNTALISQVKVQRQEAERAKTEALRNQELASLQRKTESMKTLWNPNLHWQLRYASFLELLELDPDRKNYGGANFSGFNFYGRKFEDKFNLRGADLTRTNMRTVEMNRADLRSVKIDKTIFDRSKIKNTLFNNSEINGSFKSVDLSNSVFADSNLRGSTFQNAKLDQTSFLRADMTGVVFWGTDMTKVRNLTQNQVCRLRGDVKTILPPELKYPAKWFREGGTNPSLTNDEVVKGRLLEGVEKEIIICSSI